MLTPAERAERNITWIEGHCVIPEGMFAGQPVRLMDWQKDELRKIYGNPAITRKAILSFAKKNAKTTLAAFILLLHIFGPEARPNSQICSTATSRDQAGLLCDAAAKSALLSPTLSPFIIYRASKKQIFCRETGVLYSALSADSGKAHGRSSVLAIHDECGQETGPTSKLITAVGNAMGAHINPLEIFISTQAPTDGAFLSILIDDFLAGHNPKNTVSLYAAPLENRGAMDPVANGRAKDGAKPTDGTQLPVEKEPK